MDGGNKRHDHDYRPPHQDGTHDEIDDEPDCYRENNGFVEFANPVDTERWKNYLEDVLDEQN